MSFDREGHTMGWLSWFLNLLKKTPTYLFMSPTTVLWNQDYSSRAQASLSKVPLVILLISEVWEVPSRWRENCEKHGSQRTQGMFGEQDAICLLILAQVESTRRDKAIGVAGAGF